MIACSKGDKKIVQYLIENKTCRFTNIHDKTNVSKLMGYYGFIILYIMMIKHNNVILFLLVW